MHHTKRLGYLYRISHTYNSIETILVKLQVIHVLRCVYIQRNTCNTMQNNILFRAEKRLEKCNNSWEFNILLLFEGRSFLLTETPIHVNADDVVDLCPESNPYNAKVGTVFTDTIDIENIHQFEKVFKSVLTNEATELLQDVYSGRSWVGKIMDATGKIHHITSCISDTFSEMVVPMISDTAPCWMEISFTNTTLDKEWNLIHDEPNIVFSNIHNGMAPLNANDALYVLNLFTSVSRFSDHEEFKGIISKQGNSLVLKVTDQCRRMGVDIGDEIDVVLDCSRPGYQECSRAFDSKNWTPIDNIDNLCHLDNRDLSLVQKFLDDFEVIGTVDPGYFTMDDYEKPYRNIFDHLNFFKTKTGENIIVSQPYKYDSLSKEYEMWANIHGCSVTELSEYSWHRPPETTLLVIRRVENPEWRLPTPNEK